MDFSALELPADEILDMNLDGTRGAEAIQWTQTEDGAGVKMTVAEEDGTQTEWSVDCSQAQVWIADLDRNGVKEICVSGDPMSDDDVTWCLTYEAGASSRCRLKARNTRRAGLRAWTRKE